MGPIAAVRAYTGDTLALRARRSEQSRTRSARNKIWGGAFIRWVERGPAGEPNRKRK
jgi:hypothetical protein